MSSRHGLFDEIAWERGAGREKLRRLVDEAREDIRAGRVRELRPEDICSRWRPPAFGAPSSDSPLKRAAKPSAPSSPFRTIHFIPPCISKKVDDEDNVWAVRVGIGYRALGLCHRTL
jgi:hypothetical protein